MPRDYYEILGIERNATPEQIKKAFRRVGKKYHPDVSTEPDAQARFQEANEAYQVLSDPQKRRAYDQFGHAGVDMSGMGADFTGFGFDDIFEDLMGAFTGRARTSGRRRAKQGRDLRYDMRLSFEQSVFGDDLEIDITRMEACEDCGGNGAAPGTTPITCPDCNGAGQIRQSRQIFLGNLMTVVDCPRCSGKGKIVEDPCKSCTGRGKVRKSRKLEVNIPPGVSDGTQIRLSGEGEPGENGGPNGNLYVVLSVDEHAFFKRHGHDIVLEINLNVAQAALGADLTVPTTQGEETIQVKAGTQTGDMIRIKDQGFPKLRADGRTVGQGDQLCVVNVVVPTKLTNEQKALFEQLQESLQTDLVKNNADNKGGFFERLGSFFSGNS